MLNHCEECSLSWFTKEGKRAPFCSQTQGHSDAVFQAGTHRSPFAGKTPMEVYHMGGPELPREVVL